MNICNVIQFSGGRSSAYMTEKLLSSPGFNFYNTVILFENTGREHDATLDFIHQCDMRWQSLYNISVTWLQYNPELPAGFEAVTWYTAHRRFDPGRSPFEKLIDARKFLPNRVARTCTRDLKIRVGRKYLKSLGIKKYITFVGIRHDEPARYLNPGKKWAGRKKMPMVEWRTNKHQVMEFWKGMPFDLQLNNIQGNCDLCFLKGIGKIKSIIRSDPAAAAWWIEMENKKKGKFRSRSSYQKIKDTIDQAPEFEFREDYECDVPCHCTID